MRLALRIFTAALAVALFSAFWTGFTAEKAEARGVTAPRVVTPSAPRVVTPSVTPKSSVTTPQANIPSSSVKVTTPNRVSPPQNIRPNSTYKDSPYVNKDGYYSPYLITAMGTYLILSGANDNGDPVYVNAESGEEIEGDRLEELDAKTVDQLPNEVSQKPSEAMQVMAEATSSIKIGLVTIVAAMIVLTLVTAILIRI